MIYAPDARRERTNPTPPGIAASVRYARKENYRIPSWYIGTAVFPLHGRRLSDFDPAYGTYMGIRRSAYPHA